MQVMQLLKIVWDSSEFTTVKYMKCIPKADNSVVQSAETFAAGLHS